MEYLVRFAQVHESFRKPELQALADLARIDVEFLEYSQYSPHCIIRLPNEDAARTLISRSILSKNIYELWGSGRTYEELHQDIKHRTLVLWQKYKSSSFKFEIHAYRAKRSLAEQNALIQGFRYLGFEGPIQLRDPEQTFCIFEECEWGNSNPKRVHFGRLIAGSSRGIIDTYTLKKRRYLSTTSMDSELALVTANLTQAAPGKVFYDPFVGTGSFLIGCAHFGAFTMGSDIDGRAIRGKNGRNILTNFQQYGLVDHHLDDFIADLTHSPLLRKSHGFLDGIICDPPYGVREGLKVLGSRDGGGKEIMYLDGVPAHLQDHYLPPKRPYSFEAMLDDILDFAAGSLVEGGRLSLWMPTANDEDGELGVPRHGCLEVVSVCVQGFNKWSRRLLTYQRLRDDEQVVIINHDDNNNRHPTRKQEQSATGTTANDLNSFRKRYFEGFKEASTTMAVASATTNTTAVPPRGSATTLARCRLGALTKSQWSGERAVRTIPAGRFVSAFLHVVRQGELVAVLDDAPGYGEAHQRAHDVVLGVLVGEGGDDRPLGARRAVLEQVEDGGCGTGEGRLELVAAARAGGPRGCGLLDRRGDEQRFPPKPAA
ncbi:MAG: hypothetical protein Q9216_006124 [Gyalolechia sp. 2 TL-2023]